MKTVQELRTLLGFEDLENGTLEAAIFVSK